MQEDIEAVKRETFLYPDIKQMFAQKQRLRCSKNKQACYLCISQQCSSPGLMCQSISCQCRILHQQCHQIFLIKILNGVMKHQQRIPQNIKELYKEAYKLIDETIDHLSATKTNLQLQQHYFRLRQQELRFVQLISQQKTQQINGKFIFSLEKILKSEINCSVPEKDQIIKDFQSKRALFRQICKQIEKSIQIPKNLNEKKLFSDSKIVTQFQQKQLLGKWLIQVMGKVVQAKIIFRASQHSFKATQFHKYCDGKPNTLIIVKNQYDKIIGGFTPKCWKSPPSAMYQTDETGKSFVYSLNLKQKFKCINPQRSIYNCAGYGPIFGEDGQDLCLGNNANQNPNTGAGFPYSYNSQTKPYQSNRQTHELFAGCVSGSAFKVKQYQVYQIKDL